MRYIAVLLAGLLILPPASGFAGQDTGLKLNLVVVEGEGAINNIRQRTAREPIVQVDDENHKPIAGAVIVFTLPSQGAGGAFAGGAQTLTVMTDAQGRAVARGFQPNHVQGRFQIHVNASYNGQTASTNISQTNVGAAAAGAAVSAKLIILLAAAAAGATVGALYATHTIGGGNGNSATMPPSAVTISPGTGTVGPPR